MPGARPGLTEKLDTGSYREPPWKLRLTNPSHRLVAQLRQFSGIGDARTDRQVEARLHPRGVAGEGTPDTPKAPPVLAFASTGGGRLVAEGALPGRRGAREDGHVADMTLPARRRPSVDQARSIAEPAASRAAAPPVANGSVAPAESFLVGATLGCEPFGRQSNFAGDGCNLTSAYLDGNIGALKRAVCRQHVTANQPQPLRYSTDAILSPAAARRLQGIRGGRDDVQVEPRPVRFGSHAAATAKRRRMSRNGSATRPQIGGLENDNKQLNFAPPAARPLASIWP